jgi:hypothetical protein
MDKGRCRLGEWFSFRRWLLLRLSPANLTPDTGSGHPSWASALGRSVIHGTRPRSPHRLHEGEDIFARRDTPVRSAAEGIVWKIGDNPLGGNCIWVLGSGGWAHYYAHLDHWAEGLYTGEEVQPGALLGYVGNTGKCSSDTAARPFSACTVPGGLWSHCRCFETATDRNASIN